MIAVIADRQSIRMETIHVGNRERIGAIIADFQKIASVSTPISLWAVSVEPKFRNRESPG
jgi:hypothetical protein